MGCGCLICDDTWSALHQRHFGFELVPKVTSIGFRLGVDCLVEQTEENLIGERCKHGRVKIISCRCGKEGTPGAG